MSKYVFMDYVEKYMESVSALYATETWKTKYRRYKRMNETVKQLKLEGLISTMSPHLMKESDVREILIVHRRTVKPADMEPEIACLRKLLDFSDNVGVVDRCIRNNPQLKPNVARNRNPALDEESYQKILKMAKTVSPADFYRLRAYTLVLMCICTGTRNKEIRNAELLDLDTNEWLFHIVHVKGEGTYGRDRFVPVPQEIRPLLLDYLFSRKRWLVEHETDSPALIISTQKNTADFLTANSLTRMADFVRAETGVKFDLRKCRRTFGQRYLDHDLDIESTSVLMGHSTTKTTETFYGRRRNDKAVESARKVLEEMK